MIFSLRHWVAIFAAGLGWSEAALGQESPPASGGSSGGSGSGSSGSSNAGSAFGSGSGSSSSFSVFSSEPAAVPTEPAPAPSGSTPGDSGSSFSTPSFGSSATPQSKPPSFTVPGFYGQGSTTFFGGSGRLARPRFRTGVSFGIGYDDNLFSTPSDDTPRLPFIGGSSIVDAPEQQEPVQQFQTVTEVVQTGEFIDLGGGLRIPEEVTVTRLEPIDPVENPIIPPQERKGSLFSRVGLNIEMQRFTRRSLFTLNASGSQSYYFDRDEEPIDYNGSFAMTYLFRLTPRLQMTAQANVAYISQPDLSRPNTPQTEIAGDLINSLARLDVSYRITPRLSLTATANYTSNRYTEVTEQTGDFDEYTFGLEGRYLWTPRLTLLAELRHATTIYATRAELDSTTDYLLFGGEFILSQRLSGSLRVGGAFKSFDTGDSQISPYVESTVSYRSTARSSITWTNRFGFEEPNSPTQERLVYRSSLTYGYAFSPQLQGSISANIVHEISTDEVAVAVNTEVTDTGEISDEETEVETRLTEIENAVDTVELTLGLNYQMTRDFSLVGSYTFTLSNSNSPTSDYYRNRIFFGGQYNF